MKGLLVQIRDPLGDGDGGHAITGHVGDGAGFGHESINAQDEGEADDRDICFASALTARTAP